MDGEGKVKISDFGTSKVEESESIGGTPFWMAPEVVNQFPHSFECDIWSLGCLVVEMLTGH